MHNWNWQLFGVVLNYLLTSIGVRWLERKKIKKIDLNPKKNLI